MYRFTKSNLTPVARRRHVTDRRYLEASAIIPKACPRDFTLQNPTTVFSVF